MDLAKILALISAAQQAYSAAIEIAKEVGSTFSETDQAALQAQLVDLKAKSDADHAALQAALGG